MSEASEAATSKKQKVDGSSEPTETQASSQPNGSADHSSAQASSSAAPTPSADKPEEPRKRKRKSGWDNVDESAVAPIASPVNVAGSMVPLASLNAGSAASSAATLALIQAQQQVRLQQIQATQMNNVAIQQQQAALQAQLAMQQQNKIAKRIYVGSLLYDLNEEHLRGPFSAFGTITKIDMPREPNGKSKGFCFIEYASEQSADAAIQGMNGFLLGGRPIKVNRPAGGPSSVASTPLLPTPFGVNPMLTVNPLLGLPGLVANPLLLAQAGLAGAAMPAALQAVIPTSPAPIVLPVPNAQGIIESTKPPTRNRIYVGSVYYELGAEQLQAVFEAFGKIKSCELIPNPETGKHKGYGFIEFEEEKSALDAIENMNGFELLGRKLKVGPAHSSMGSTAAPTSLLPSAVNLADPSSSAAMLAHAQARIAGMLHTNGPSAATLAAAAAAAVDTQLDSLSAQENVQINSSQRSELMKKLAARTGSTPAGKESQCVALTNMVSAEEADSGLEAEVKEECESFGSVEKVVVHVNPKKEVVIFVWFDSKATAAKAREQLDRRYFGGRVVGAQFFDEKKFLDKDYTL